MALFPVAAGQRITAAMINHSYSIADANVTTVTAATNTDLSSIYQIPASDAAVGMSYQLTAWGNGTWGSTAQTLQWLFNLAGNTLGTGPILGTSVFATSTLFRWECTLTLEPVTIGSTATWGGGLNGVVTETGSNVLPTAGNQNSVAFAGSLSSGTFTQDSTVANNFSIQAAWGSTTGAPTITCRGTRYTRFG